MKTSLLVFLDCEFTDFIDCHLISLGMVTERGEECYIEVPYPIQACSAFVREVVIPLLGKDANAVCELDQIRVRILNWIEIVRRNKEEDVCICFDYQTDFDLFMEALDGDCPTYIRPRLINHHINELLLYNFWRDNPNLYQHHALHDARANTYAFRDPILSLDEVMTGIPDSRNL